MVPYRFSLKFLVYCYRYIWFSYGSIRWQEQGKSKAYATQISTVFVQCHMVLISECPPLKLVLYTLEQVQTEIDSWMTLD